MRRTSALIAGPLAACAFVVGTAASGGELQLKVENTSGAALENAVVSLIPQARATRSSALKANIDQVNRTFVPRISVVQTGTSIEFPNSDNIRHSVYSFSPAKVFTLNLYAGKPASPVLFDKPGVVALGCNIHDHMLAWLLVVDTPYFARTNSDGLAILSDVPAGDYRIQSWHEPMTEEIAGDLIHVDAAAPLARTIQLDVGH